MIIGFWIKGDDYIADAGLSREYKESLNRQCYKYRKVEMDKLRFSHMNISGIPVLEKKDDASK